MMLASVARHARRHARRAAAPHSRSSLFRVALAGAAAAFHASSAHAASAAGAGCPIEPLHALDLARSFRPARAESPLPRFAGRVVLLVNTASLCGYAPQLASMQALHERFGARGLLVVGVPSNSFGQQEPGRSEDVPALYASRWGVSFPLTAITHVTGGEAHALYLHMQHKLGDAGAPAWNFHKYLFDAQGDLVGVFGPSQDPLEEDVVAAIEDALVARERAPPRTEL